MAPIRALGGTTTLTPSRTTSAPWLFVMLIAANVPRRWFMRSPDRQKALEWPRNGGIDQLSRIG
jgi:hypothetical protein